VELARVIIFLVEGSPSHNRLRVPTNIYVVATPSAYFNRSPLDQR
jgi:hypothetical protein